MRKCQFFEICQVKLCTTTRRPTPNTFNQIKMCEQSVRFVPRLRPEPFSVPCRRRNFNDSPAFTGRTCSRTEATLYRDGASTARYLGAVGPASSCETGGIRQHCCPEESKCRPQTQHTAMSDRSWPTLTDNSALSGLPLEGRQIDSSGIIQFHAFALQKASLQPFRRGIVSVADASLGIHNSVPRHVRLCGQ